ncbi:hypothetical protein COU61_03345 [Candidatus Pacearchaeota archaeon CG10_big_fil_rev_8_21_14_0_10_35_13]|nr:MAG: hypothetical protein COU61_03345 [Candidatus Pacearchaeota archaeon CG10_big_fil_rev_8_21_14_0_10_35_13]
MVHKRNNEELRIINYLSLKEAHVRMMERDLGIPRATLIRRLKEMEELNIIDYKTIGKNKQYFIKKGIKTRKILEESEHYKLIELLRKEPWMEPLFDEIIKKVPGGRMIILFGSYAKNREKNDSDLDLYVETEDNKMKKELEKLNTKISVKIGKFNKESLLIREIIKNHIMIKGVEKFYEQVFD